MPLLMHGLRPRPTTSEPPPPRRRRQRTLTISLLAFAALGIGGFTSAVHAPSAWAGDYWTYPCGRYGDATPGTSDGISVTDGPGSLGYMNTTNACTAATPSLQQHSHLPAGYQTYQWNGDGLWRLSAASNTTLRAVEYFKAVNGIHSGFFWDLMKANGQVVDTNSAFYGHIYGGWRHFDNLNTPSIAGRWYCNPWVAGGCVGGAAWMQIFQLSALVNDPHSPTFTSVPSGSLFGAGAKTGTKGVSFSANDAGGGIYKAQLLVDGSVVETVYPDTDNGRCVKPFRHMRPCKLSVTHSFNVNTAALRDGEHDVRLVVYDATEDGKVTSSPTTIVTANKPVNTAAPRLTRLNGAALRVGTTLQLDMGTWERSPTGYERSWLRCPADGQLEACEPIAGAAGATYTLVEADAYMRILARVTAKNASGQADAVAPLTAAIADDDGLTDPSPRNKSKPGWAQGSNLSKPRPGMQLRVDRGAWEGRRLAYDVRFKRCIDAESCVVASSGTTDTYTLTEEDVDARIVAEILAYNFAGSAIASSPATAVVQTAKVPDDDRDGTGRDDPSRDDPSRDDTDRDTGGGGRSGVDDRQQPPAQVPDLGRGQQPPARAPIRHDIVGLRNPIAGPGHKPNGSGASENARNRATIEVRRGKKRKHVVAATTARKVRHVIRGRLRNEAGKPIAGAKLVTAWQQPAGKWVAKTGVVTQGNGTFTYLLPKGPSRRVRFVYFAFSDSRGYSASNTLNARVRAPVSLRITPRAASNGRRVRFSGAVARDGLPRTGVLVTLEARYPGSMWKQFRVVRTTRSGAFSARYRFTSTTTRTRYSFRARVAKQGAYPFESGISPLAGVTVTP